MAIVENFRIFLTVAPLLYFGIWLIAEESFFGSKIGDRLLSKKSLKESQKRKVEQSLLLFVILSLSFIASILIFWQVARVPFFLLLLLSSGYLYLGKRKELVAKKERNKQVDLELPGVIQMMTLLISSGVSPIRSLEIIAEKSDSQIAEDLRWIVSEVKAGRTTSQALDGFAQIVDTQSVRRFTSSLIIALERGSPLVSVLTSLVRDARADNRTELMRRAGKSEIALMIPVVFLLLPISVLFALFPSLNQLQIF